MQKATVAYSIYIFDNSPCDERWMMKLQDLQTIQTCHCQRMSKTYENRSIQRWALPSKPDHWNPENKYMQIWKKHLTQTCESLWCENLANNGNQPRNPHFHSEIHHLHVRRSLLDQPWMTKLQHLQTIQTCHCQRMSKTYENRSIQRWALPSKPDHWNPEKKYMQIWKKNI